MEEAKPNLIPLTDQDKDRLIHSMAKSIAELEKKVVNIQNDKVLENLQLPADVLESVGVILPQPSRLRRGGGWRPLLESEVKEAQEKCDTAHGCAKYLGIGYKTYRKWAKTYGLFKTKQWSKGSKKGYWAPDKGKYPLNQILEGKFPDYPVYRLKDILIRSGIKQAKCENCGFDERRITDNKMPLILNFEDGNDKNHVLSNIRVFCYNCTFNCGKGYIRKSNVKYYFSDPDRIQGASSPIPARF